MLVFTGKTASLVRRCGCLGDAGVDYQNPQKYKIVITRKTNSCGIPYMKKNAQKYFFSSNNLSINRKYAAAILILQYRLI